MSNAHVVHVTREDGTWLAEVEGVAGGHTYARTLPKLRESIREVIVLADDLDDDAQPNYVLQFDVDDALVLSAVFAGRARDELEQREAELAAETRMLARRLSDAGWSVRDAADMLHLTPGRISQLVGHH
jgi:predicted RNase H-like HicB family nuclease